MKSLTHPDYRPTFKAARLTPIEEAIVKRWGSPPHIGFLAIGKLHGMSDSEARIHFDNAIDKLAPHWSKSVSSSEYPDRPLTRAERDSLTRPMHKR